MAIAAHYLKLSDREGAKIEGESEGHDFIEDIDVTGWDWQVTDQSAKTGSASDETRSGKGGRGAAAASDSGAEVGVEPSTFTFTKSVDRSTTRLMKAMHQGEVLKQARFTLLEELVGVKDERSGAFRLHVALDNVIVVGYRLTGSTSEFRVDLEEEWELSYSKISFLYETARMEAQFDRNPGSSKRKSAKPALDFAEELRRHGIEPDNRGRLRGRRG